MNTELTNNEKTKTNLPATQNWSDDGLSRSDILISKLLLQQPLSDYVAKGIASPGDIVESVNGEVIAKKGQGVEIILVKPFKTWMQFEMKEGKWAYTATIPFSPLNAHWKYEDEINGKKVRNDAVISMFVLLSTNIDSMPYLVSFRRSSYTAGKKLVTHWEIAKMKKEKPASKVFELVSELKTVDKNSFWVFDVKPKRQATKEEMDAAYGWNQTFTTKAATVEDDNEVPF